jgi:Flp pilus assembly protein TadD
VEKDITGADSSPAEETLKKEVRWFRLMADALPALISYVDSEYHYHYGLTLALQNKFREAEKAFERARRLEPHNARYLAELGAVCLELGYPARAKGLFEKVLSIAPDNVRAAEGLKKIDS